MKRNEERRTQCFTIRIYVNVKFCSKDNTSVNAEQCQKEGNTNQSIGLVYTE